MMPNFERKKTFDERAQSPIKGAHWLMIEKVITHKKVWMFKSVVHFLFSRFENKDKIKI